MNTAVGKFVFVLFVLLTGLAARAAVIAPLVDSPSGFKDAYEGELAPEANWHSGFGNIKDGRVADVQTRFRVFHDNHSVYFVIEAEEPEMENIRAGVVVRDGSVWNDDCVEVFLDPNRVESEYYHLVVNSTGVIYDSKVSQEGIAHDRSWNSGAKARTAAAPDMWRVELAVPLVSLGLAPASEEGWRFNITRTRYAGGALELTSFARLNEFHQPGKFAWLSPARMATRDYYWDFSPPADEKLFYDEDGGPVYQTDIGITNNTGRARLTKIIAEFSSGEEAEQKGYEGMEFINSGQTVRIRVELSVPGEGENLLRFFLYDYNAPSVLYAARSYPLNIVYNPIEIRLTSPPYRDSIYSTQEVNSIAGEVVFNLREDMLSGKVYYCRLYMTLCGTTVEEVREGDVKRLMHFDLPASGLETGDYTLEVSLGLPGSREKLYRSEVNIRKLPPPAGGNEVWFDEHGACYVNGEPFLPFGIFDMPSVMYVYPGMENFNVLQRYAFITREMMDKCLELGVFAVPVPFLSFQDHSVAHVRQHPERLYEEAELDLMRKAVAELKEHPALLAWYLVDEPGMSGVVPERILQAYEAVKDADPYHPVILLEHSISGQYRYAHCADLLMPDPYPSFPRGGASPNIDTVTAYIRAAREATGGRKPVWFTPKWFLFGHSIPRGQREANLNELRNMHYQAVIQGARGIIGYTMRGWRHYASFRLGLPFLSEELMLLKGAVMAPEVEGKFSFCTSGGGGFFWSYREYGGAAYIFAVNTRLEELYVKGEFRDSFTGLLHVVSEDAALRVEDGIFEDVFEPHGVRIYTTDSSAAGALNIKSVEKEIDGLYRRIGPLNNYGDLARLERGVKAAASSESFYKHPLYAVDGILSMEEDSHSHAYLFWEAASPAKPDWLTVVFPRKERISFVVVNSPNLSDFILQTGRGDEWLELAAVRGNRSGRVEITLDEPVEADNIRIYITGTHPGNSASVISELEVYSDRDFISQTD